jgi:hypothetical protein
VEMSLSGLVCEKQTDNTLEVQAWDLFHMWQKVGYVVNLVPCHIALPDLEKS